MLNFQRDIAPPQAPRLSNPYTFELFHSHPSGIVFVTVPSVILAAGDFLNLCWEACFVCCPFALMFYSLGIEAERKIRWVSSSLLLEYRRSWTVPFLYSTGTTASASLVWHFAYPSLCFPGRKEWHGPGDYMNS